MKLALPVPDFILYDPMEGRDFRGKDTTDPRVHGPLVDGDKADIMKCDIVLANLTRVSVGTSMEIIFAHSNHKHVVVVGDPQFELSPWILYHSHVQLAGVAAAIDYIKWYHGEHDIG